MLIRMMYVSTIHADMTVNAMTRLVAGSQRRNRQLDLTGALLKCDGHFAQVLEGREAEVSGMMARIAQDRRHSELHVHNCGSITRRLFADWDMAFIISAECGADVTGYLQGEVTPVQFVEAMVRYVEDKRALP